MKSAPLDRLEKIRKQLQQHQVDCLALIPGNNLRYLTGVEFMLFERPFIVFIPADAMESPVMVLPELEAANWNHLAPFEARLFPWSDQDGPDDAMRQAVGALKGVHTLGVEHLRMRVLEAELVARFMPGIRTVKGEEIMNPLRLHKDEVELASHRKAVHTCEEALEEIVSHLSIGDTERQICSRLTSALLKYGGENTPIEPAVLCGMNAASPHGRAGDRRIAAGDILLFDFVTTVDGYYADITRCFVIGRQPDERLRSMYEAVKAANAVGRAAVRPGATCQDVDRAARKVLVDAGFGKYFIHRTGHGMGLDVHEDPGIVEGNEMPLEEGMVFSIEPGSYIEGWAGIRIEDDMVVTKTGGESLTTFDREIRVVGG
jgi:Xaa-Pro dipeptidase